MTRHLLALILSTLPALVGLPAWRLQAQEAGYRFSRPVQVPRPGWVRLLFEPAIRRHMITAADLRLLDPNGRPVYYWTSRGAGSLQPATARILSVEETEDGWQLTFDLGPTPPTHEGLHLDIADHGVIPGTRLEGSDDRSSWRHLTAADLFRLGEGPGLQRTSLVYSPTNVRYLRLWWPRSAGLPEVRQVGVTVRRPELLPRQVTIPIETLASSTGGVADHGAEYRLSLPGPAPYTQLRLQLAGTGATGYRLLTPTPSQWVVQSEGRLPQLEDRHQAAIALAGEARQAPSLRLELFGHDPAGVQLTAAVVEFQPEWLIFQAKRAGQYTLAYSLVGQPLPAPPPTPGTPPPVDQLAEVTAGSEVEHQLPPLPAWATAPGAPIEVEGFTDRWEVIPEGGKPPQQGSLVQVELTDQVSAVARPDLGDVRVVAGQVQLPYVWRPIEEPELYLEQPRLVPEPTPGTSKVTVDLLATDRQLSALELSAPAAPFRRPVSLVYVNNATPDPATAEYLAAESVWTCQGQSPVPCWILFRLGPNPTRSLEIRVEDGDNAPLPLVRARVWRSRTALVFPWPEEGPVRLAAGNPSLARPQYDLEAIESELLARPAIAAHLEPIPPPQPLSLPAQRYLLLSALVLAALVLILILGRMLAQPEGVGESR